MDRDFRAVVSRGIEYVHSHIGLLTRQDVERILNLPRELLSHVYGQFGEGFDTADLRAAKRLLAGALSSAEPA